MVSDTLESVIFSDMALPPLFDLSAAQTAFAAIQMHSDALPEP